MTLAIAVLLVAGALLVHPLIFGAPPGSALVGDEPVVGADISSWASGEPITGGNPTDTNAIWPPVPADARAEPLGSPTASTSSSTDFAFVSTISELGGRPVAWDPCRPIHIVVNSAQAPPRAEQLLREAVSAVASATGLQFVVDGPTAERPGSGRAPVDKAEYGNRWSPVLVAWTDPSVVPDLQDSVAGFAGPTGAPYYTPQQEHWVSGTVYLDGPQFRDILRQPDGVAAARAIVMHEFGHLVGLAHVSAADQIMYEHNIGQRAFAAGDREGLRQLGLGPCFTS